MGITLLGVTQLRHQHLKNLNFFGFSILIRLWQNIHVQIELFITILNLYLSSKKTEFFHSKLAWKVYEKFKILKICVRPPAVLRLQHFKILNFFGFSILLKLWQNIHVHIELFITILNLYLSL